MRLKDRIAIVVGAGQRPGEGIGNGRATALTFAREGAKVLCVDHNLASAQETVDMIAPRRAPRLAFKADVTKEAEIKAMVADAHARWGRIDILHNNVGVSLSGGDAELLDITEEALDRCIAINLKSCIFAARHVLPIMRAKKSGAIINISSMAVITTYPYVAYKATKSAMVSFTEQLAYQNAQYGIRANVILPGLMNTPMAVDTRAREFKKSPPRSRPSAIQGAAAQQARHRLGRRQRRAVPGVRRGKLCHRRDAAGGWRGERKAGLTVRAAGTIARGQCGLSRVFQRSACIH